MKNRKYINGAEIGNSIHTKEEAKTKDEYFKILKFYQTQVYKTKAGEYNPNGRIKLHKGDDSVEIVLVGNSMVGNKAEVLKDGDVWVVLYAEGTKSKEFDSEAEAKKFAAQVGNGISVPPATPAQKPGSKPQSAPDTKKKDDKKETTDKNGRTFREVLEEVKKTGNKYNIKPMSYKADAYRYGKELAEQDFKNFKYSNTSTLESIYRNNTSGEDYEQYGFLDFKKGYYDTYQKMDKKVGNSTEKLFYGLSKDAEKEEEKSDEALDELKKTGKVLNSKVVNYKTGTSKLKPGDKVESFGSVGVVKSIKGENEDNIYGEPLIEVEFKTGTKKVVPEHYLIKVGNSASDDKFAYVMREFDEGKLKTPDGKVVTDPAQAKAIAYSESKKTENGLARARNAIKKNS